MTTKKTRELVHLRSRLNKNGSESLYLDYFDSRGRRIRENLHLFILPNSADNASALNANAWRVAEAARAERTMDLLSGRIGTSLQRDDMLVADVLKQWSELHENPNSRNNNRSMSKMLLSFLGEDATLRDLNRETCAGFSEHLQVVKGSRGKRLTPSTASTYWQYFCACVSWAHRKGWLSENPCTRLERAEKPKYSAPPREYLTIEELRMFAEGDPSCHFIRAYLFACFCGLRWSDIEALRWSDLRTSEGRTMARVVMKKTEREINIPLSKSALKWLPPREESPDGERVFALGHIATAQYKVREYAKKVGIKKHLTFHTSRHTFATTMLTRGADLFVTSKLLGHTNVRTTQIYANIVDEKKRQAVDLLDNI